MRPLILALVVIVAWHGRPEAAEPPASYDSMLNGLCLRQELDPVRIGQLAEELRATDVTATMGPIMRAPKVWFLPYLNVFLAYRVSNHGDVRLQDCLVGLTQGDHDIALRQIQRAFGVSITSDERQGADRVTRMASQGSATSMLGFTIQSSTAGPVHYVTATRATNLGTR